MQAKLRPLKGKYYSTEIEVGATLVSICGYDDFEPSDRELEDHGITREQYESEEQFEVDCPWTGDKRMTTHREDFWDCNDSSHMEVQGVYEVAKKILEAINATN